MLLGDSCTGKTCLLIRFKDNTFMNNNFISTVGIDFRNKLVDLDRCKVKLQIWDTAGQERFRSLTASYYRDADALLLVYDVTKRSSFDNIRDWLAQVKEYAKESVQLILVGNKTDLASERKVRPEEGRQLAQAYNIGFMETSAKSGHNVHEVFLELSRRLVRTTAQRPAAENGRGASDALKLIDEREPYQHQQQQQEAGWSWTGAGGLVGKGGAQCCG
uniref:Ras-related protein Rab-26 n=1 Tax=Globodera pallida TaxID=36090 RepID=A0A183BLX5_GLOPA